LHEDLRKDKRSDAATTLYLNLTIIDGTGILAIFGELFLLSARVLTSENDVIISNRSKA